MIEKIREAIVDLEEDDALELVQEALDEGVDPSAILKDAIMDGLKEIGRLFGEGEYYLAELVIGGELTDKCIELVEPHLPKNEGEKKGTVVIGAVKGDLHDIGYGLVAKQLELAGYEVHQIGIDTPSMTFIEKAKEFNADIIGLSAFLVTTIPYCAELIQYLKDLGLREKYKVIIGGTETSQAYSDEIGADGWSADAVGAVALCNRLMGHTN